MNKRNLAVCGIMTLLAVALCVAQHFQRKGMLPWQVSVATLNKTAQGTKETVVIDAGHGGFDPGKVGTRDTLEKDINLAIAKKVEKLLADSGYTVYMTRTEDVALAEAGAKKKKASDLKNRVALINQVKPALAVSIHQNSYSAGTKGAQVFYYKDSEEAMFLAGCIQNSIRESVGDENKRVEKANDSYYMLKHVECPFAIAECGFLSNPEEEALLCEEDYQEKIARGICEGIERYLYGEKSNGGNNENSLNK